MKYSKENFHSIENENNMIRNKYNLKNYSTILKEGNNQIQFSEKNNNNSFILNKKDFSIDKTTYDDNETKNSFGITESKNYSECNNSKSRNKYINNISLIEYNLNKHLLKYARQKQNDSFYLIQNKSVSLTESKQFKNLCKAKNDNNNTIYTYNQISNNNYSPFRNDFTKLTPDNTISFEINNSKSSYIINKGINDSNRKNSKSKFLYVKKRINYSFSSSKKHQKILKNENNNEDNKEINNENIKENINENNSYGKIKLKIKNKKLNNPQIAENHKKIFDNIDKQSHIEYMKKYFKSLRLILYSNETKIKNKNKFSNDFNFQNNKNIDDEIIDKKKTNFAKTYNDEILNSLLNSYLNKNNNLYNKKKKLGLSSIDIESNEIYLNNSFVLNSHKNYRISNEYINTKWKGKSRDKIEISKSNNNNPPLFNSKDNSKIYNSKNKIVLKTKNNTKQNSNKLKPSYISCINELKKYISSINNNKNNNINNKKNNYKETDYNEYFYPSFLKEDTYQLKNYHLKNFRKNLKLLKKKYSKDESDNSNIDSNDYPINLINQNKY